MSKLLHLSDAIHRRVLNGSPGVLITTRGVLRFHEDSGEAFLAVYHPFMTINHVKSAAGWPLAIADHCALTPPPTLEELRLIRDADPDGFWTR